VCMVDIENERNPQAGPMRRTDGLQPACVTKVREGMKVHTHTKAVLDNIRFILQLLRAKHPNTCATCDADGQCTFQDLLYRFQVRHVMDGDLAITRRWRQIDFSGSLHSCNCSGRGGDPPRRASQVCALA
jgi:NADH-quinone oxidoreductase subunit G